MSKPSIAFIVPDKIQNPVGGMGVQAKYLQKHLQKDFEFDVYGFPEDNNLPYYHPCFNPLPKIRHHGLSTISGQIIYFTEVVRNKKPDLIHVSDYTIYLSAVMASRALNVPLVVSVQLSAHLMEQYGLTFAMNPETIDGQAIQNTMKEIELLGLREAQRIIHVSEDYKNIFAKQVPEIDSKSVYIPNGIDLEEYADDNPEYKKVHLPGKQKRKIIYIGRFATQKNVVSLNQATVPENIDLIFIGPKENGNPVFQEMFDKSITTENIHYYGPAYDAEKVNMLKSADAVIVPSLHECHPIVMHEAMASGCVVLHSGAGDMKHVLKDDFAIPCGTSPESISQALKIFGEMSDAEIMKRKKKGLEIVRGYTWKNAANQTADVYRSILE